MGFLLVCDEEERGSRRWWTEAFIHARDARSRSVFAIRMWARPDEVHGGGEVSDVVVVVGGVVDACQTCQGQPTAAFRVLTQRRQNGRAAVTKLRY